MGERVDVGRILFGAARYVVVMGRRYGGLYSLALRRNNEGQSIQPLMTFCQSVSTSTLRWLILHIRSTCTLLILSSDLG